MADETTRRHVFRRHRVIWGALLFGSVVTGPAFGIGGLYIGAGALLASLLVVGWAFSRSAVVIDADGVRSKMPGEQFELGWGRSLGVTWDVVMDRSSEGAAGINRLIFTVRDHSPYVVSGLGKRACRKILALVKARGLEAHDESVADES